MNVAVISTSPREGSNSLKVSKFMKGLLGAHEDIKVTLINFEKADIPLIGRGVVKEEEFTEFQAELISNWQQADLVLFAVPEYNWITGGELINAFHQLGSRRFQYLFENKTFAFAGVSNGRGGRRPCLEMTTLTNKVISILGGQSVVAPLIFESQYTQNVLDEQGESKGDASYEKAAAGFISYILKVAERWKKGAVPA